MCKRDGLTEDIVTLGSGGCKIYATKRRGGIVGSFSLWVEQLETSLNI